MALVCPPSNLAHIPLQEATTSLATLGPDAKHISPSVTLPPDTDQAQSCPENAVEIHYERDDRTRLMGKCPEPPQTAGAGTPQSNTWP